MKIKVFYEIRPEILEQHVNEWLLKNEPISMSFHVHERLDIRDALATYHCIITYN